MAVERLTEPTRRGRRVAWVERRTGLLDPVGGKLVMVGLDHGNWYNPWTRLDVPDLATGRAAMDAFLSQQPPPKE